MLTFLINSYGVDPSNTIHLTAQTAGQMLTLEYIQTQLKGKQDLFVMIPNDTSINGLNASGHVDLLNSDGTFISGHDEYMFARGGLKKSMFFN